MVYSAASNIRARFPGVAPNEEAARGFVERLVMQTTTNVIMSNWSRANMAKSKQQSSLIAGLGSIRIALLLGNCDCRRKLNLNCNMSEAIISV
ncbi:hypothetical protein KIN20_022442 [Parelaphostrongylus tenuis]|uniref:Uncharacterized protein n=1 Tax=Parelaphostrongylus tenuis TaxID=148309 RepID=A0AAD5QV65_PARTN|nr:hypothetical protein KIN20_022442 [Parelaphostrongylus tenuis]